MSDMEYPPREVLRVPTCMPEIPANIDPLNREVLGLLTEGEEMSGEHLHHSVSPSIAPPSLYLTPFPLRHSFLFWMPFSLRHDPSAQL